MSRHGEVLGTTQIWGTADRRRAWNVVLLAEGFTRADLEAGTFAVNAQRIADVLLAMRPFSLFRHGINVFRVDVRSDEAGADEPTECGGSGATPDTFFDARFCEAGVQRLLVADTGVALEEARRAVPEVHAAMVVVNSMIPGGSGGEVPVCSIAPGQERVAIHEFGHSKFGLGDEYEYLRGCGMETDHNVHGFTFFDLAEPNLTVHEDRGNLDAHKWGRMVSASTPIPTMTNPNCRECNARPSPVAAGTIGLFEGAHYYHCDAYRPAYRCMMRSENDEFCAVCQAHISRRLAPFVPAPTVAVPEVMIAAAHSGKALDVSGISHDRGAPIIQWDWWNGPNQRWRIEDIGGGMVRIRSVHSGRVLDVSDLSRDDGARIIQWDWWNGPNQRWRVEDVGGGLSRIVSVHSGKVLDVSGVSHDNGAPIIQWSWRDGANQKWRIVGVASPTS